MIKIWNVRTGHASNSSSEHSVLLTTSSLQDKYVPGDQSYGYQHFVLASKKAKLAYLAQQLGISLERDESGTRRRPNPWIADIIKGLLNIKFDEKGYVDHQSLWNLPVDNVGEVHREFFKELTNFILRSDVVIKGGSDQDEWDDKCEPTSKYVKLPFEKDKSPEDFSVARKDPSGFWTIYNRHTGYKIRFSWDDLETPITHSDVPELVDLKITNRCSHGCPLCYQDSSPAGDQADVRDVMSTIEALARLGVFEIAIGGGEPTEYSGIERVLGHAKDMGVTPNLTTRSVSWTQNPSLKKDIFSSVGKVAFSVTCAEDVLKLYPLHLEYPDQVGVQIVVGIVREDSAKDILCACSLTEIPICYLGYKYAGRATRSKSVVDDTWFPTFLRDSVKETYITQSVDTVLVSRYYDLLLALGMPEYTMTKQDGLFSMYIDAVKNEAGPCSYEGPRYLCSPGSDEDILRAFRSRPYRECELRVR